MILKNSQLTYFKIIFTLALLTILCFSISFSKYFLVSSDLYENRYGKIFFKYYTKRSGSLKIEIFCNDTFSYYPSNFYLKRGENILKVNIKFYNPGKKECKIVFKRGNWTDQEFFELNVKRGSFDYKSLLPLLFASIPYFYLVKKRL